MGKDTGLRTVRDFDRVGYTISPSCSHHFVCSHYRTLPIEYLAEHLGWDFDLYARRGELLRRLTCSRCGWHFPTITVVTQQSRGGPRAEHGWKPLPVAEALKRELEHGAISAGYKRRRR
jgi:hypothetical protein